MPQDTSVPATTGEERTKQAPVPVLYTNYRGETAVRQIVPWMRHDNAIMRFGSTDWHPEPQWLFSGVDIEKDARRDWAMSGIRAWGQQAVNLAGWRVRGESDPHGDRYDCPREQISGGHLTDDQVAFQTAMIGRHDLDHEMRLGVARDRIRWLSRRVAALEATLAQRGGQNG